MGTASFSIARKGKVFGSTLASELVTSGDHTTSTTVSSLTDGAAGAGSAITGVKGDAITIEVDEKARINFGGTDATATSGHLLPANQTRDLEINASGTIRIIDVA